jgi:hypothetical protein
MKFPALPNLLIVVLLSALSATPALANQPDSKTKKVIAGGLDWLAHTQSRLGHWSANGNRYPTAMTALAGMALLGEGSTTTQGKYSENIRRARDYLVSRSRANGLIGDPVNDDRYTYGHGYSMLFLSQVLGEEEDATRRKELIDVLDRAVLFTGRAQTEEGGWGYLSARDGQGFDEGSTTITQVQGLRGCRNAGIAVPKEIIEKAIKYIDKCTIKDGGTDEGGVQYSSKGGGPRPAITGAAIACLFNAGDYDDVLVPKMQKYADTHLGNLAGEDRSGHWHYAHYYFAQVRYRQGGDIWEKYRDQVNNRLISEAETSKVGDKELVSWNQSYVGAVYTTAVNLTIMQLDRAVLPIYQR